MRESMRRYLAALALVLYLGLAGWPAMAQAADSAVILMYHRFGESAYPSTNIKIEQLEAHIQELTSGGYTVLPVAEIMSRIRDGNALPDRAVGITIDDGYRSIYTEAWPRFRKAGLPFTIFISTDPIDRGADGQITWDQIREMRKTGVRIGAHTGSHLHMVRADENRNRDEITRSNKRLMEELGEAPTLFAYPYGETGLDVKKVVDQAGYAFIFGQHSGAIGPMTDLTYIPRFALNENFGSLGRLKLVINALPLPAKDFTPLDTKVGSVNPPHFGFTVARPLKNLGQMNCFVSGEGRVPITRLGESRIEIRPSKPFGKGRTRINCTLPADGGRWHWLGTLFVAP